MPAATDLMSAIREAFSQSTRPDRFTVASSADAAWSDDEMDRAEAVFASRIAETFQSTDVGIGAGWPEVFLTQAALDYYMPGFARLLLDAHANTGFGVDDFFNILSPDRIATWNQQQRAALADVLDFIRNLLDEHGQEIIDRRLKRLRA